MRCPECGSPMAGDDCPYCGYGLITRKKNEGEDFGKNIRYIFALLMVVSFVAFLVFTTAVMVVSTGHVYDHTTVGEQWLYVVILIPIGIARLSGLGLSVYYFLLVASVLISLAYLLYRSARFVADEDIGGMKSKELSSKIMDQPLTRLALMFSVMIFLSYLYFMLISLAGTTPSTPGELERAPFGEIVFLMTRAAVWEEIMFRLLYFGVPMMIYGLMKNRADSWKLLFGGFGVKEGPILSLTLFSAFIFALAHMGGGWDIYKFPQVFIGGIIFGYLFAKDGLYSCIIFHFAWDYMYIVGQVSTSASLMMGMLILVWMGVGVYFTYHYIKEGFRWLRGAKGETKEYREEKPDLTLALNAGFMCSQCRSYKADYLPDGRLKCKTCGRETSSDSDDSLRKLKPVESKRMWPPID